MESLPFNKTSPKAFILAADGQFTSFKLQDDQVWSVIPGTTNKHLFHFETTYGLRARSMRLIPHFIDQKQPLTSTSEFLHPPTVTHYTPSTLQIRFTLASELCIKFDCFIPEPHVLLGTVEIENQSEHARDLTFELSALLVPMKEGKPIRPEKEANNQILMGQAAGLFPVLFMTGGPNAIGDPYPALTKTFQCSPHQMHRLSWALVSKESTKASYKTARKEAAADWQLDAQQQVMKFAGQTIDIQTGDPDWDHSFFLAQVNAMAHQVASDPEASNPYIIKCRHPDYLYTEKQDPRGKALLSNLEMAQLSQILLPARPDIIMRLIERALDRQQDKNQIPVFPLSELNGCQISTCPLLSRLSLAIFEITGDEAFLERVFPTLRNDLFTCLPPSVDHPEPPFPVWGSPDVLLLDTGLFSFDPWSERGRGLDIQTVVSPALGTLLYQEVKALKKIAQILGDLSDLDHFNHLETRLTAIITACWQEDHLCFAYIDRQSYQWSQGDWSQQGRIERTIQINKNFNQAKRLHLQLISRDESTRACIVHLEGQDIEGEPLIEKIRVLNLRWVMGKANVTTENLFKVLEKITFEGLSHEDQFLVETVDLSQCDISCLLPLGMGSISKQQIAGMVRSLLEENDIPLEHGLPETWQCQRELPQELPIQVNVLWNTFIIEGLARQGFLQEAMQLFTKLMATIVQGLKDYDGFYPLFAADSGLPVGDRNTISSLPPLHTFLHIAGIRLFTPNRVAIWGDNPFPWPITIRWQGLTLCKQGSKTKLTFANGASYEGESSEPLLLTSDRSDLPTKAQPNYSDSLEKS